MKVFLINLKKDTRRLAVVDERLRQLGVEYERVEAVYAKELAESERNAAVDGFRWWCAVGRSIRVGEIGCAMSHYSIYRQMTEPVCVLEDDVILDDRFPEVLRCVEEQLDVTRPQVFLLSDHTRRLDCQTSECLREPTIVPTCFDMYTEGYVITPKAAQALLKANFPLQVPCDHWGRWAKLGLIELYHALPTVCSQDQSQYASGTVAPHGFFVDRLSLVPFCIHKLKRLVGKTIDNGLLTLEHFEYKVKKERLR